MKVTNFSILKLFITSLTLILFGSADVQSSAKSCGESIEAKDWDSARPACLAAAISGNLNAKVWVAWMFHEGKGGDRDGVQSTRWLHSAARSGHGNSQLELGKRYLIGDSITKSIPEAMKWLRAAAGKGKAEAQFLLGSLYAQIEKDHADVQEAFDWLSKASRKGSIEADYLLARLYFSGTTENFDDKESAIARLENAAQKDHTEAQYALGSLHVSGKINGRVNLSRAEKWLRLAARKGHARAQYEMGRISLEGTVTQKKLHDAYLYFKYSAESGIREAQYHLGQLHLQEQLRLSTPELAFQWLKKSAENGYVEAQEQVAFMFNAGKGVAKDDGKGFEWMLKAARNGSISGAQFVAAYYYIGHGTDTDFAKAASWYRKAADAGSANAQFRLGRMYGDGKGVSHNRDRSVALISGAAHSGHEEALLWVQAAAEAGDAAYQYLLAKLISTEMITTENPSEWYSWLIRSVANGSEEGRGDLESLAEKGNAAAQFDLGRISFINSQSETGIKESLAFIRKAVLNEHGKALNWLISQEVNGSAEISYILGEVYRDSGFSGQDIKKSISSYEKAVRAGHADAAFQLGFIFHRGNGVRKNEKKAIDFYKTSADLGNVAAQYNLGRMFFRGDGVVEDIGQARRYLTMAASRGHEDAQRLVKRISIIMATEDLALLGYELRKRADCDDQWITYGDVLGAAVRRSRECRIDRVDGEVIVEKMPESGETVSVTRYQYLRPTDPKPEEILEAAKRHYGSPSFEDRENWALMYGDPVVVNYSGNALRETEKENGVGLFVQGHLCSVLAQTSGLQCAKGDVVVLVYKLIDRQLVKKAHIQGERLVAQENREKLEQLEF